MSGNQGNTNIAILGVGIAAAVTVVSVGGAFDLWDAAVGIILLLLLHAYVDVKRGGRWEKWAYSAVWALCFFLAIAFVFDQAFLGIDNVSRLKGPLWEPDISEMKYPPSYLPINWQDFIEIVMLAIITGLKRSRL